MTECDFLDFSCPGSQRAVPGEMAGAKKDKQAGGATPSGSRRAGGWSVFG